MKHLKTTFLAALAALLLPAAASAYDTVTAHVMSIIPASIDLKMQVGALSYAATTTGVYTVSPKAVVVSCVGSDTCSAPTTLNQFVDVTNWTGFTVTVEAESGKTLTGVGTVDCYSWDPNTYNAVSYQQDISLSVTKSGVRRVTLQGQWFPAARGRIVCVPTGVITSATGGVTLYIDGWTNVAK